MGKQKGEGSFLANHLPMECQAAWLAWARDHQQVFADLPDARAAEAAMVDLGFAITKRQAENMRRRLSYPKYGRPATPPPPAIDPAEFGRLRDQLLDARVQLASLLEAAQAQRDLLFQLGTDLLDLATKAGVPIRVDLLPEETPQVKTDRRVDQVWDELIQLNTDLGVLVRELAATKARQGLRPAPEFHRLTRAYATARQPELPADAPPQ